MTIITEATTTVARTARRQVYNMNVKVVEIATNDKMLAGKVEVLVKGQPSIRPFTAYGQAASNLKRYFKVGKTLEVAAAFEGATLRVRGRRFGSRAADAARAAA